MKKRLLQYATGWLVLFLGLTPVLAIQEVEISIEDQELTLVQYPARGEQLILWVAPGYGSHKRAHDMSEKFAALGIEVWHVDLSESLFLPKSTSSMRTLSGKYIAALIDHAHQQTGKQITLLTRSNGSIPVLRGAREWQRLQQQTDASYLSGAILFSPELYSGIPSLGLEAEYLPIVDATNIPIMLYQGGARGNRWQLNNLVERLQQGGASVFVKVQVGVTGMFYEKDSAAETISALDNLPREIETVLALLQKTQTPRIPAPLVKTVKSKSRGLDITLKPFKGNPLPQAIDMYDVNGNRLVRNDYRGKVTIVNFWASWCPPCVEEIPSLNNLRKQMQGKPFELISINYAEDKGKIRQFMQTVNVDFPVLLDESGQISAAWNVLVFPSTFVIDTRGRIHYGVNAAIHWDAPEVVEELNRLLEKK